MFQNKNTKKPLSYIRKFVTVASVVIIIGATIYASATGVPSRNVANFGTSRQQLAEENRARAARFKEFEDERNAVKQKLQQEYDAAFALGPDAEKEWLENNKNREFGIRKQQREINGNTSEEQAAVTATAEGAGSSPVAAGGAPASGGSGGGAASDGAAASGTSGGSPAPAAPAAPAAAAGSAPTAAPAAGSANTGSAVPGTFNVKKILTIGEQGQRYFIGNEAGSPTCPVGTAPIICFIVQVIDFLILVIGSVAILMFVVGALLTIVSEGSEDRLQKGKNAMLYALVGVAVAMMSFVISTFVQSIFY